MNKTKIGIFLSLLLMVQSLLHLVLIYHSNFK